MDPPVRVACVDSPDACETIENALDERVTIIAVDAPEELRSTEADCVLCVEPSPETIGEERRSPMLVLTDDEETARDARLAGMRVLPMEIVDQPDALFAQIEATTNETPPRSVRVDDGETIGIHENVAEQQRATWTLERLLETTRDLLVADGRDGVATVTVSAANRALGLAHTGIHLVDGDGRLDPVAYTDTVEDSLGTVPALERGESLAWEVFESGEDRIYEGVHEEESAHNPETHLRSEMIFSLGDHGVLIIASEESEEFDDADVYFTKLLAATATVALDRAARESALEEKNDRLEEFVGVVSHDLRNPLTVAEGSISLAKETGDDSHLDQVSESHQRIREIIEGLLVLAREGRAVGETRPVIVGTVAEEAWANVDTDGATLAIGDDRTVHADRNRLTQLFENAFRNSVEHADSEVTVTVEATPEGFRIDDDGPGIPAGEREAALEPGFSTDEGTGFGMVIMQNIAEGHDWTLSLGESDGGGLRIEITTDADEKDHSTSEQ